MPQVTLTNLIPDPDFENQQWSPASRCNLSYNTQIFKYGTKSLQVSATNSQNTEAYFVANQAIPQVQNHTYYARFEVYQTNLASSTFQIYWPQAEPSAGYCSYPVGTYSQWVPISFYFTRTTWASGNQQFRIDCENFYTPNWTLFDGAMLIDLTACFGSGNEPDKTFCDALPFFTGTMLYPPISARAKIDGEWKNVSSIYQKRGGAWSSVSTVKVNVGGSWK